jgi:hypothetical protein
LMQYNETKKGEWCLFENDVTYWTD